MRERNDRGGFSGRLPVIATAAAGFALRLLYIFYTSVETRQHDVGKFGDVDRHAGYIEYLLYHRRLPDFDVREVWQFYHPPLHHAVSAVWLWVCENVFCLGYQSARESLQFLTLFYSMAILFFGYRILKHFKLEGPALYAPFAVIAFHPTFVFFSGSINNDVLAAAFVTAAVFYTLKWYENRTPAGISKIALCIGLGMMTKLSAALVAVPVAVVFAVALWGTPGGGRRRLSGQFALFGLICVPLGLAWPVRNLIRFGVPLNYVQEMDPRVLQYIGDMSFWKRITDFSPGQPASVFEQFVWRDENGALRGYNEHNPLIALLKTAVFGEFVLGVGQGVGEMVFLIVCVALFWLAAALAAVSFAGMIFAAAGKTGREKLFLQRFLALFHMVLLAGFYQFSREYPFVCTMDFRYITPTVITGALFYGLTIRKFRGSGRKVCRVLSGGMAALAWSFSLVSALFFLGLA